MRLLSVIMLALLPFPAQDLLEGKLCWNAKQKRLNVSYQYTEDATTQMTVIDNPVSVLTTMEMQVVNPNKMRMD